MNNADASSNAFESNAQLLGEGNGSTADGVPAAVPTVPAADPIQVVVWPIPDSSDQQQRRASQARGRSGCCHAHGDPSGDALHAESYPTLQIRTVIISGVSVPLDHIAFTQGLGRFAEKEMIRLEEEAKSDLPTKPKKPRDQGTIHLSPSYICRNHCSGSACRFASNCRFAHVCPVHHPNLIASTDPSASNGEPRLVAYPDIMGSVPMVSTFAGAMMPPPSYSPFVMPQPGRIVMPQLVPAPFLYAQGLMPQGVPAMSSPQGGIFIQPSFSPSHQPMLVGDPPRALTLVPAMSSAPPGVMSASPPNAPAVYSFPSASSPPQFIFGGYPLHR